MEQDLQQKEMPKQSFAKSRLHFLLPATMGIALAFSDREKHSNTHIALFHSHPVKGCAKRKLCAPVE